MSSQNQATSETILLLGDHRPAGRLSRSLSRERSVLSPETLLIPVAVATKLATQIPLTTVVDLVRQAVCRFWNVSHGDPATLLAGGPTPHELCDTPEVERYFAVVVAILGVTDGILSMAGCGIFSRISSHYGRKPAFLILLISGIVGSCLIPGSRYAPDWFADWVFFVGLLLEAFSGLPCAYLVNMYVVDVCVPKDRTAALSKIAGWASLGTCISFVLGGSITTKTGDPSIVFYMSAALLGVTLIYVIYILPESFPEEKRNALFHTRLEPSIDALPTTSLLIFEPLRMLIPTRKLDGTRNWRLAWCAAHTFIGMAASGHVATAWVVLATSKYHLTPVETGIFLSVVSVSSTIVLAVIVPPLVRFLRPYYSQNAKPSLPLEEDISDGEEPEPETSDRLDVHLAFVSCIIGAVSYLTAAASTTNQGVILSAISVGFSSVHAPTIRSLVAGSVDPLHQGEAMAAIEIVFNAGIILSPIVMGSILTATINTTPLLMFYVHLVVVLISSALLFFVRDEDKYRKPHEE